MSKSDSLKNGMRSGLDGLLSSTGKSTQIRKTSKRFRQRKEPKGGKEKNNVKLTAIWIKSNW